jgi:hypothetical protein
MATEAARIIRDLIKEVRRNINNHESLDPFFFDHFNRRSEKNQRTKHSTWLDLNTTDLGKC